MKSKNYKYNINYIKKNEVCNDCLKYLHAMGLNCPYRENDNEYCGTVEDCKHARQLNACKYVSSKLKEAMKNLYIMEGDGNEQSKK